jgi:protein-tyrosine phosphatase
MRAKAFVRISVFGFEVISLLVFVCLLLSGCTHLPPAAQLNTVGERIPSQDPAILDFHTVGTYHETTLFRSASPLRDLIKKNTVSSDSSEALNAAADRMASLRARGIRTIISFENPDVSDNESRLVWINLEQSAAASAGIQYVSAPLTNSGPNSFETMSPLETLQTLQSVDQLIAKHAPQGNVLIHCSAGHDRTGVAVAFLRLKYSHFTPDQAIAEMRYFGHNWPKFSHNGGTSSWHEDQIRSVAPLIQSNLP